MKEKKWEHNFFCRLTNALMGDPFMDEDKQRGLEADAVDYIAKPFDVDNFILRIVSQAIVNHRRTPISTPEDTTK